MYNGIKQCFSSHTYLIEPKITHRSQNLSPNTQNQSPHTQTVKSGLLQTQNNIMTCQYENMQLCIEMLSK